MIIGTLINAGAIVVGGAAGLILGSKIPAKVSTTFFNVIGLFTLFLGIAMSTKTQNPLLVIFSLILGGLAGTLLNLQERMENSGIWIQEKLKLRSGKFNEGLMTAFLIYCVGSMAILGAIQEGMGNHPQLLLIKSLMDGFTAIALAASLGLGVLFSAIPLIVYQGSISLLSFWIGERISDSFIAEIEATGGIMLIGLALSILNIKKIEVMNLIPALVFIIPLYYFFG